MSAEQDYKSGKPEENLIWKIIEDFQEMMTAEGLDRETEINNKHLSYNEVEVYLYSLLPNPAPKEPSSAEKRKEKAKSCPYCINNGLLICFCANPSERDTMTAAEVKDDSLKIGNALSDIMKHYKVLQRNEDWETLFSITDAMNYWVKDYTASEVAKAVAEKDKEIKGLQSWKDSALIILNEIDLQEVGHALKVTPGRNISPQILPGIKSLKSQLSEKDTEIQRLKSETKSREREAAEKGWKESLADVPLLYRPYERMLIDHLKQYE